MDRTEDGTRAGRCYGTVEFNPLGLNDRWLGCSELGIRKVSLHKFQRLTIANFGNIFLIIFEASESFKVPEIEKSIPVTEESKGPREGLKRSRTVPQGSCSRSPVMAS